MKLTDGWLVDDNTFRWVGTNEEFDQWLRLWRVMVPKCHDFICCHDSDSCCINYACGEGSIVSTMRIGTTAICESVNCIDCLKKYRCKYGHQSREQNKKEEYLKFIEIPTCDICRYRNENGKKCSGIKRVFERGETFCSAWRLWMEGDD